MSVSPVKPIGPEVHYPANAPLAWFLLDAPGRTFASDTGDVADLMRFIPAQSRGAPATWGTDDYGACLALSGASGSALTVSNALPSGSGCSGTVRARVTLSSLPSANALIFTNPSNWLQVPVSTAGALSLTADGAHVLTTSYTLAPGVPADITCCFAPSDWRVYANGVLVGSTTAFSTNIPTPTMIVSQTGFPFAGTISFIESYTRALSGDEVARDFADPYWRLRRPRVSWMVAAVPPAETGTLGAAAQAASGSFGGLVSDPATLGAAASQASASLAATVAEFATLGAASGPATTSLAATAAIDVTATLGAAAGTATAALAGTATTPPDLLAAVDARLRATPGLIAALGESLPSTPKIESDKTLTSPANPWLRIDEPIGIRKYYGSGNYIETGQLLIHVFHSGRLAARRIGWLIHSPDPAIPTGCLDGAALTFSEGVLMRLVCRKPYFAPVEGVGVAAATEYHLILPFDYMISGQVNV